MAQWLSYIKQKQDSYKNHTIVVNGIAFNTYQTLRKIDHYYRSQFLGNALDDFGNPAPFYNITKHRVRVAVRATDFDRKDVELYAKNEYTTLAHTQLMRLALDDFLDNPEIGMVKNRFGRRWAKYGGALLKVTYDAKGMPVLSVPAWHNLIVDPTDIENGLIIERIPMHPHELNERRGVWYKEQINRAIELADLRASSEGENAEETVTPVVDVYEIHGYVKDGEDKGNTRRIVVVAVDHESQEEVVLFNEEEKRKTYYYAPYEEDDGRSLGVGVVEDLFEAQEMTNDSIRRLHAYFTLVSKVVFQTPKGSGVAVSNVVRSLRNGDIITYNPQIGKLERMELINSSYPLFERVLQIWERQADDVTSTYPGVTGEPQPSGTPLGSVQLQNIEGASIFEYRREELGLFWERVYNDVIVPALKDKLVKDKKFATELAPEKARAIDETLAHERVVNEAQRHVRGGKPVDFNAMVDLYERTLRSLKEKGNAVRFIVPDDFRYSEIHTRIRLTNERKHKNVLLQSLDYAIKLYAANRDILQTDPVFLNLLNRMLDVAGLPPINPFELPRETLQSNEQPKVPSDAEPPVNPQEEALDKLTQAKAVGAKLKSLLASIQR